MAIQKDWRISNPKVQPNTKNATIGPKIPEDTAPSLKKFSPASTLEIKIVIKSVASLKKCPQRISQRI